MAKTFVFNASFENKQIDIRVIGDSESEARLSANSQAALLLRVSFLDRSKIKLSLDREE